MVWDLKLVYYRLLQFHCAIHAASVLCVIFVSGITTFNKNSNTSDVFGDSLSLFVAIISRLNCSTRIPLNKDLLLVII